MGRRLRVEGIDHGTVAPAPEIRHGVDPAKTETLPYGHIQRFGGNLLGMMQQTSLALNAIGRHDGGVRLDGRRFAGPQQFSVERGGTILIPHHRHFTGSAATRPAVLIIQPEITIFRARCRQRPLECREPRLTQVCGSQTHARVKEGAGIASIEEGAELPRGLIRRQVIVDAPEWRRTQVAGWGAE
ncbi:MAG: hypothetical protein BWY76_01690 [bacterium ADurb.Bin429]|nr:MAG: hypothetical protein BWY76_01690 [bacterium ADurb.Bin429]